MARYNVHEAKTKLSRLLQETVRGEEVVIMRDGEPVASLIPYRKKIGLGFAAGQVIESPGWEKALPDDEASALVEGRL